MIERLKGAFDLAEQLLETEQQALAELLIEEIWAFQRWNDLFSDPRSDKLLERLVAEAIAEDDAGESEEIRANSYLP
ncbi:MAG TPA: hypothetical protein VH349_18000 [Ktedonobacterales bacterium]|jgi:hypothetical protein